RGARGIVAFCGGLDIVKSRVEKVPLPGGSPLHDVHLKIRGPAANALLGIFVDRWRRHWKSARIEQTKEKLRGAPVERPRDGSPATPARGDLQVSVVTTMNRRVSRSSSDFLGMTEDTFCASSRSVTTALTGAIRAARSFIYLE